MKITRLSALTALKYLVVPSMLLLAPGTARADFTGVFALPWSETGTGSAFLGGAPASLILANTASANYDYFIVSPGSAALTFDWFYSTGAGIGDASFYFVNGSPTSLATDLTTSSSVAVSLNPGDTFGFRIFGNGSNSSTLTIGNFTAIPEPSTMGLMVLGAAGLIAAKRRRKAN